MTRIVCMIFFLPMEKSLLKYACFFLVCAFCDLWFLCVWTKQYFLLHFANYIVFVCQRFLTVFFKKIIIMTHRTPHLKDLYYNNSHCSCFVWNDLINKKLTIKSQPNMKPDFHRYRKNGLDSFPVRFTKTDYCRLAGQNSGSEGERVIGSNARAISYLLAIWYDAISYLLATPLKNLFLRLWGTCTCFKGFGIFLYPAIIKSELSSHTDFLKITLKIF